MKIIFTGLTTLFLSLNVNATPVKMFESGGRVSDVHLRDYSEVSPTPNPERDFVYTNWSADNAGFGENGVKLVVPEGIAPPQQHFWSAGNDITLMPDSRVYLGEFKFWNWEAIEGSNSVDLTAALYPLSSMSGAAARPIINLLAEFDVADSGNTQLVKFSTTNPFSNFSLGGSDYNFTFDSICKVDGSSEDCGSHQSWFSVDKTESKFKVYAKLGSGSVTDVPEPSSLGVLFGGLAALVLARRRKRV
jgi:hypothetical protein